MPNYYQALPELSADEIGQHQENIAKQGFSIMENAIDADFLSALQAELELLEEVRPGGDIPPAPFTGFHTRRWFDLLNDGDIWQQVGIHPWVLAVLSQVLGDGFLLSTMGTAVIGPGEEAQGIHCDDMVYMLPRPHPNLVCNTMWALDDFTEENGATRIVPGSNLAETDPEATQPPESFDTIGLKMPAGSIAFVLGTTYHGAGANQSNDTRYALTINYCNGRMRQQENLMLGVRQERLMSFPTELQDILGLKICQGAGHIFALDPREEMIRRYGTGDAQDPYLERRNALRREARGSSEQS
ncbi:MAG: phytanoyl-CoA dioxygenase [Pseudomonadales bacterium]|nr:phytanoyl-CoA dioxygenase [Pseudomonadales bacterium]